MSRKLESDVCCRLQVAPSGESYEGKRRPGRKQRQTTAGIWRDSLHVTCGLTACTPGSAPGPTLGNRVWASFTFTFTPQIDERNSLSVCPHTYLRNHASKLLQIFAARCLQIAAVIRSYLGGVAIHYVLPVSWVTSCLPVICQSKLVAWHSGRTSVFGRRTFPILRSTCS